MITFFRKIRRNMIKENKVSKYLLYAIGEIILVVIGILIALQVNNWNEVNKIEQVEIGKLKSLKQEIIENLVTIEDVLKVNTEFNKNMDEIINYPNSGGKSKSSNILRDALYWHTAIVNSPILDQFLKSESKILNNDLELQNMLINLKLQFNYIEKTEYYLDEFWNTQITNYLIQNDLGYHIFNVEKLSKTETDELLTLYESKSFKSIISLKKDLQASWYEQQVVAIEKSKEVLGQLKHEQQTDIFNTNQ